MYSRGIKLDGIRKGESNVEALWMEGLRWRKWFSDGWIKEPKGMSKCSKDLLGERILCVRFRLCWQKIARINHFPWDPWARGNTPFSPEKLEYVPRASTREELGH